MHCVNFRLQPMARFSGWDSFQRKSFICHRCEKIFKGKNSELYYFPELDLFFHRHRGDVYYRAFWIGDRGSVHIGASDSEAENVIQRYGLVLDGKGGFRLAGDIDELRASSKKFFQSMRRQNRQVVQIGISIRPM